MTVTTSKFIVLVCVAITLLTIIQSSNGIVLVPEPFDVLNWQLHIINSITFGNFIPQNKDHQRYLIYLLNNINSNGHYWINELNNGTLLDKLKPFFENDNPYSNTLNLMSFAQYCNGIKSKYNIEQTLDKTLLDLLPSAYHSSIPCTNYMAGVKERLEAGLRSLLTILNSLNSLNSYNETDNMHDSDDNDKNDDMDFFEEQLLHDFNDLVMDDKNDDMDFFEDQILQRFNDLIVDSTNWCDELLNDEPLMDESYISYIIRSIRKGIIPVSYIDFPQIFGHIKTGAFNRTTMKDTMPKPFFIMVIIMHMQYEKE